MRIIMAHRRQNQRSGKPTCELGESRNHDEVMSSASSSGSARSSPRPGPASSRTTARSLLPSTSMNSAGLPGVLTYASRLGIPRPMARSSAGTGRSRTTRSASRRLLLDEARCLVARFVDHYTACDYTARSTTSRPTTSSPAAPTPSGLSAIASSRPRGTRGACAVRQGALLDPNAAPRARMRSRGLVLAFRVEPRARHDVSTLKALLRRGAAKTFSSFTCFRYRHSHAVSFPGNQYSSSTASPARVRGACRSTLTVYCWRAKRDRPHQCIVGQTSLESGIQVNESTTRPSPDEKRICCTGTWAGASFLRSHRMRH